MVNVNVTVNREFSSYTRGLQTFLCKGHVSCYIVVREPDILRNMIALT